MRTGRFLVTTTGRFLVTITALAGFETTDDPRFAIEWWIGFQPPERIPLLNAPEEDFHRLFSVLDFSFFLRAVDIPTHNAVCFLPILHVQNIKAN